MAGKSLYLWPRSNAQAISYVVLSTAIFSFIFTAAKWEGGTNSASQVVFLRCVAAVTLLALHGLMRDRTIFISNRLLPQFVRAATGVAGGACATYATAHMPVITATAIGLLEGVLAVGFGALLLREHIPIRRWLAALVCASGAYIAVTSFGPASVQGLGNSGVAITIALFGAAMLALEGVFIRILAIAGPPVTILFYTNLFGVMLTSIPAVIFWIPISPLQLLGLLALGPLALVAQYLNVLAFGAAPVSVVAPAVYTWIVFSGIIGLVGFGEQPSSAAIFGCAVIVAGGVWLTRIPAPLTPSPLSADVPKVAAPTRRRP